jgi:hypothetical protein
MHCEELEGSCMIMAFMADISDLGKKIPACFQCISILNRY